MYVKGAECVQVDYRNGIGYQSVYIVKNLPEVKTKLTPDQKKLVFEYAKSLQSKKLNEGSMDEATYQQLSADPVATRKLRKDLEKIITKYLEPFADLDLGDNDVSLAVKTFFNEQISYIV